MYCPITLHIFGLVATLSLAIASPILGSLARTNEGNVTILAARDNICGTSGSTTKLIGDGNPHQVYLHKQLTDTLNCAAAPSCSETEEHSHSYNIDFSITGAIAEWIDGGFDVGVSYETSDAQQCQGSAGQTVCLWQRIAFTAYTVQNYQLNLCAEPAPLGDPVIITSPNNGQTPQQYCVVDTCRTAGQEYWATV